jgi:hypothetical protein
VSESTSTLWHFSGHEYIADVAVKCREEVRDVFKNTVDRIVTFAKDMAALVQMNQHRVTV